jgi:hypothetical protein
MPEADRPLQPGEVAEQLPDGGLAAPVDGEDEEEGSGGQRAEHGLRRRHALIVARPACGQATEAFE